MGGGATTFDLRIEAPHADPQELEILTFQLRRELPDLDDAAVNLAAGGGLPPGSKGIDPTARTVRIRAADGDSLDVVGVSSADQRRLIDAWIDSHARH